MRLEGGDWRKDAAAQRLKVTGPMERRDISDSSPRLACWPTPWLRLGHAAQCHQGRLAGCADSEREGTVATC